MSGEGRRDQIAPVDIFRHFYGIVAVPAEMVHRPSIPEDRRDGAASAASGGAGDGRF